jgi:hypothetical protein
MGYMLMGHRVIIVALLTLTLSSCGLTSVLNPLSSKGGPTVNANVLAGKENTQQAVGQQNRQDAGRDIITSKKEVEAESIEEVKISNTNIPVWVMLLLILGWLLPTPDAMGRWFVNIFTSIFQRKK